MPSVGSSDAVFTLNGACVHALRFAFGAPLGYPYASPIPDAGDNPPPALFRRIVAASTPTRAGQPWQTGMQLAGEAFDPETGAGKLTDVVCTDGIPSLDAPEAGEVRLDEWFRIQRREKVVDFPGDNRGNCLLSIKYWNPIPEGQVATQKTVAYYDDQYDMKWAGPIEVGDWVAVSFDAFYPPDRDSADIIIQVADCNGNCGSRHRSET